MAEYRLPFHDKKFDPLLKKTALLLGFETKECMLEKLDELGAIEMVDWFLIHDLVTLSKSPDPETIALLMLLFQNLERGSLCLTLDATLLDDQLSRLGATKIGSKLAGWPKGAPEGLLCRSPETTAPLVFDETNGLLYFQKLFLAETALKTILADRLRNTAPVPDTQKTNAYKAIIEEVCIQNPPSIAGVPVELNREQQLAVAAGLSQPLLLITGGPGTGKTSLVAALLRSLLRAGTPPESIRLTAPTGRAAQRLSDAIRESIKSISNPTKEDQEAGGIISSTIHRLLSYNPRTGGFRHERRNPIPYDVLIVDEASMISANLMASLLAALPKDCRVIMIGDKDQLPSVEAGAILSDLLPETPIFSREFSQHLTAITGHPVASATGGRFLNRTIFLTKSYRSEKDILEFAGAVNSGQAVAANLPLVSTKNDTLSWPERIKEEGKDTIKGGSCWRLDPPAQTAQRNALFKDWIKKRMIEEERGSWISLLEKIAATDIETLKESPLVQDIFRMIAGARILTALRQGPLGCESLNRTLCQTFKEEFDPGKEGPLFHGLPILITQNDASRGLFNGDVGVILRGTTGSGRRAYRAFFDRPGDPPTFALDELPAWEAAFAITIHKSQGSEYGEVLLVMPEQAGHNLNTREILYTGVTRGKRLSIIVGSIEVIDAATATPNRRESGLKIWSQNPE